MKIRSTEYKVQSTEFFQFRIPNQRGPFHRPSAFRNSYGFSYIALLVAIVIIGISLGAAGKYWQNVMLREKEEELIFRGNQYRQAIERYYAAIPGRPQYPQSIDDLLTDNRTAAGKRHLRQQYKDPMTGEDFEIITAQTATGAVRALAPQAPTVPGIIGVRSKSEKEPLKKDNFEPANVDLAGKTKYDEWLFIAFTGSAPQAVPGQPQVAGQAQTPGQPGFGQPSDGGFGGSSSGGAGTPSGGQTPFGFQPPQEPQQPYEGSGLPLSRRPPRRPFTNYPLPGQ